MYRLVIPFGKYTILFQYLYMCAHKRVGGGQMMPKQSINNKYNSCAFDLSACERYIGMRREWRRRGGEELGTGDDKTVLE